MASTFLSPNSYQIAKLLKSSTTYLTDSAGPTVAHGLGHHPSYTAWGFRTESYMRCRQIWCSNRRTDLSSQRVRWRPQSLDRSLSGVCRLNEVQRDTLCRLFRASTGDFESFRYGELWLGGLLASITRWSSLTPGMQVYDKSTDLMEMHVNQQLSSHRFTEPSSATPPFVSSTSPTRYRLAAKAPFFLYA